MDERIAKELEMLRTRYPDLEYREDGRWIRIPARPMPPGWSAETTDVAFQVPVQYPGTPPYGIYVPAGLTFGGNRPANYTEPAGTQPPFGGTWGVFSWSVGNPPWKPAADVARGANLLNWVIGFAARFREGV